MIMSDLISKVNDAKIQEGWIIAELTDRYIVDNWPMEQQIDFDKLLEIRVFNKNAEIKISRSETGREFTERILKNDEEKKDQIIDEIQYLDIDDTVAQKDGYVTTTGGGRYYLPIKKENAKIKIRYYLDKYSESGQAVIVDWRFVEFMEG